VSPQGTYPANVPSSIYPHATPYPQMYPRQPYPTQTTFPPPPASAPQSRPEDVTTTQPRRGGNARIDPSQIPRPQYTTDSIVYETRGDARRVLPPATSSFMAVDNGNCSPRFMRATMYTVPTTHTVRMETGVPFGVVCTPMADVRNGEAPVSMVDFGESGPVRCTRCKGYINVYVTWQGDGNTWACNFCGKVNETPADYYSRCK
jgi:protein transport protein SEC24